MAKTDDTDKKGKLYYIGWIVGLSFVITGINVFQNSGIVGALYILAGCVLVPEVNNAIHKKWDIEIPVWSRITLSVVILVFIGNIHLQEVLIHDETIVVDKGEADIVMPVDSIGKDDAEQIVDQNEIEKERLLRELEDRYEEVNEILGKNYLLRSSKCLEFCHEGEKLSQNDFGLDVSPQKMSEIGDYCYSYCREDTEYYIKWYREDIKISLVRLQESIDYVKSSNAS